jgi:hypothetical protein
MYTQFTENAGNVGTCSLSQDWAKNVFEENIW